MKLGKIPFNTYLSVKRAVSDTPEIVFDVLCNVRFAGFDKRGVGDNRATVSTGKETVIGKITLAENVIGHEEIIAAALVTVRNRFNSTKMNCIVHV